MIIITGGTGFIGSALLWALNERGRKDILIVDELNHEEKEHNIAGLKYEELVGIDDFYEKLKAGEYDDAGIEAIFHLGAISSTTEKSWKKLQQYNVEYSKDVIRWCVDNAVRCIYASSGATYGDGKHGYEDDHALFERLRPLNLYGKSKLQVDIWARDAGYLSHVVGLRYFNVFGPNEYHKDDMRSLVTKKYREVKEKGEIELFKSYRTDYRDGEQKRDFLYVKDAVTATLFFLDNPDQNGVFNVGTGRAETWKAVAQAMFAALKKEPKIRYIDMPDDVKDQYQYFTQADMRKLRKAGYTEAFTPIEKAVEEYVKEYLLEHKHLGD